MTSAESIESLLARVALRDRGAFELLYQRTSAKLFGVCLRILSERAEAEEALQEAFVKIWRNAGQYSQARAGAIAWMAAIARNQSIDRLRARRQGAENIDVAAEIGDARPSPEAEAVAAADRRQLHDCLDELEPGHAAAIRDAYFGGHTYKVLARRGGVPLGTMKSWIRRGLTRLRDCLER
jgi:RNA polymerase sigma-70 factor (ECF subfamily)